METIMYLSNRGIQVVQGTYERQTLKINQCRVYPFDEGVIIDGTILNEDSVRHVLAQTKGLGINKARLVLCTGKILKKIAILPKAREQEMRQLIIDELRDINDTQEAFLYDYSILRSKLEDQSGMEVLCVGVEREFLETYITLFNSVNIELQSVDVGTNAIIKLTNIIPELNEKSYIIMTIDGNDLTSYMFNQGHYVFSHKSRLLAEQGSQAFILELTNSLSQLIQFRRGGGKDEKIENVYLCGDTIGNEAMTFETIGDSLDVDVDYLMPSQCFSSVNGEKIDYYQYAYPLGTMIRRKGK